MVKNLVLLSVSLLSVSPSACAAQVNADDPYLTYIRSAPGFRPVRQDRDLLIGRWDTWIYMPWRYRWTIGTDDRGGQFCRDFFGDRLWVETDQEAAFYYRRYRDLFATIDCKLQEGYAVAERRLPTQNTRRIGDGKRFTFDFNTIEAVLISFRGPSP